MSDLEARWAKRDRERAELEARREQERQERMAALENALAAELDRYYIHNKKLRDQVAHRLASLFEVTDGWETFKAGDGENALRVQDGLYRLRGGRMTETKEATDG